VFAATRRLVAPLVIVTVLAGGCSSSSGEESLSPTSTLAPDQITVLTAAAEVMGSVQTVEFSIERAGAPVHIDPLGVLTFNKAVGRFAAPTSADALVTVQVAGFNTEIGAVAFEGTTWLSDPISGNFSRAPGSYAFDPATLFDPEIGWRPLLDSGLSDIEWLGLDATGDEPRYRLRGIGEPERLEVITAGLVRDQTVVLDIRFDTATGAVREVEFSTVNDGETSTWTLTFHGYGQPLDVTPPPTDDGD